VSAVVKVAIGRCGATALDSNLSGLSIYGHPLTELERTPEVVAVSGVHRGRLVPCIQLDKEARCCFIKKPASGKILVWLRQPRFFIYS